MTTPIYTPEVFESTDDLLERRTRLSQMKEIPDMGRYAQEWAALAADFEACGLLSNAGYCKSRAQHYATMAGAYIRVIEQPFAELIEV